jgi:UDP-N-acetylglucosamine acyltransferase
MDHLTATLHSTPDPDLGASRPRGPISSQGMSSTLHPTAIVHPGAVIGQRCHIGPYCILGPNVVLGDHCHLHSHVVIDGHTTLGSHNEIFPFACIGLKTQDLKWKGGITYVQIGDHNVFREYVTIHSATEDGRSTVVGSHNHLLAYVHLAHDVRLGDHIIMSNVATLAGHVLVEDHAVIGGLAAVHQFCRIGKYAMVGGCSKVVQDVAPFMMADGNPAETRFVNKTGLERAGFDAGQVSALTRAYKILFRSGATTVNALARIESEIPDSPERGRLIEFVRTSQRGLAK